MTTAEFAPARSNLVYPLLQACKVASTVLSCFMAIRVTEWNGAEPAARLHFGDSTRNGRVPISAPVTASIATGSMSMPVSASR